MKRYFVSFVVAFFLATGLANAQLGLAVPQQQPAAPPKLPQLTELEQALIKIVVLSDQLATCQHQGAQRSVVEASATVLRRIETAYPGFTINWQTGQVTPKPAGK